MVRLSKYLLPCFLPVILLLVFACGIDTLNYLGSDIMPTFISQSPSGLIFSGPVNPSIPPYSGINLYYRIYASEAEAINDKSRLEQRQGIDTIPGSSVPYFLEATLRYLKPTRNESRAPPTIPSSFESDSMRIELIDGRLFLEVGSSSYELKRNLPSDLLDFSVLPIDEDSDYNNTPPTDPGPYYIQFFAASYGFNFLGSNPELFSNAVFLGRMVLSATE